MKNKRIPFFALCTLLYFALALSSCKKDPSNPVTPPPVDTIPITPTPPAAFDINSITDTYESIAPFANYSKWGPYNVHDPSIKKFGDYYYCYSTDVGYGLDGTNLRPGLQIRKSKDLVEWTFVGWVFNGLPTMGSAYLTGLGATPNNALWAPYVTKVGSEYRLYYSLSSNLSRTSVIGLATASSPEGPWTEKGLVVKTADNTTVETNAIDPTVVVTPSGDQWMYYGSAYDGIYAMQINPSTGLALASGDLGKRIAQRGFTGNTINGNIEGAEVVFNAQQNKYYIFIAYDWLLTKYNVRVGRGDNPQGPFYDYNNVDINTVQDHGPMILAPYQFMGHSGWQGTAHCTIFTDAAGQYYLASQARPGSNPYYMDLHVRKLFWMENGWPVVSPERYAWEDNATVAKDSITGQWERIKLNYNVVPGFGDQQIYPDFQIAVSMTIDAAGTLNGDAGSTWTYAAPWLTMNWSDGTTEKVFIQKGRDWENKKSTLIYTGMNNAGTSVWGKKK